MIKLNKVKPMFTALITTANKYSADELRGTIIDINKQEGCYKDYQEVLAVGDSVRGIKVGDLVCIDPTRFGVKKHKEGSLKDGVITDNPIIEYIFDTIELNGEECFIFQDRDIKYIIEDYEEIKEDHKELDNKSHTIIQPDKTIII